MTTSTEHPIAREHRQDPTGYRAFALGWLESAARAYVDHPTEANRNSLREALDALELLR